MNYDMKNADIAWCPGCGNFGILKALKQALSDLAVEPTNLVLVSGIGQAAKTPQYVKSNFFNGLHGRALPAATAIKASNPNLTVVVESGEGDMYGEGGNHFIHTIRRNPNMTLLVHNNMVYGLTKGQASPTSQIGFKTPVQVHGVVIEPFNPIAVAVSLNASFVGRAFAGDHGQTVEIIKAAIMHKGFSIVDILQPCVTFNKINTYQWFRDHIYYLPEDYDSRDRMSAFSTAINSDKFALGEIYINDKENIFENLLSVYANRSEPLYLRTPDLAKLAEFINSKK